MLNIDQDSQPERNKTTIREGDCLDNAIEFDIPKNLSRKLAAADLAGQYQWPARPSPWKKRR